MPKQPVIAIVGRPNVGKSSLLNALVGRRISIVEDIPGVTRDRVSQPLRLGERFAELVDTGGYGFEDPDHLTEHIHQQIDLAMARADLILFLVDCQSGLVTADQQIAELIRRRSLKAILVANKADGERADLALAEFSRLGLGTPIGVSALHGRNIEELLELIAANVDLSSAPTIIPEPDMYVAIVGKRNAGKSTLVNAIASLYEGDPQRVIVSEVPGTTRDSIDVRFEKDGHALVVIDTAGVRKKRHMVTNDIEFYSFHRAQRSIRRADVVMLLIDATEPVSEPDKKLAQYVAEQLKPVVLVINKWDKAKQVLREKRKGSDETLHDADLMEEYREYLDAELRHLDYAPMAFVTAKEGRNVPAALDLAKHILKQASERVTTSKLNEAIRGIVEQRGPSTSSGRRAKVYYATQIESAPPTIVLFVNNPALIDETYHRFMVNRLRELLPYAEVPIRLIMRPHSKSVEIPEQARDRRAQGQQRARPAARRPTAAKTKQQKDPRKGGKRARPRR